MIKKISIKDHTKFFKGSSQRIIELQKKMVQLHGLMRVFLMHGIILSQLWL